MTYLEAKQNAKLEAEAKRRGLQPWQVDAALAVDDKLVADIVADGRRSSPTAPTPTIAETPSRTVYAELPTDVVDVFLAGGLNLRNLPQGSAAMAQRLLREGVSIGHAGAVVFKAYRWA